MPVVQNAAFRIVRMVVAAGLAGAVVSCIIQQPLVKQLDPHGAPIVVQSPVKAHLVDGSTVVYPNGVRLVRDVLTGSGQRYMLGEQSWLGVEAISVDSIIGMETYTRDVSTGKSIAASVGATIGGAVLGTVAAVALFGSCPTIYADSAGSELLQAEGFSYSIAPLFEQRDVDRLRLTPTGDGRVVLRIKNEALETHYINQLQLIEVQHEVAELAVPDGAGHALALGPGRISSSIHDRSGRDISRSVSAADNDVFSTIDARLASVTSTDLDDYIDIAIPAVRKTDSVAIVLDLRNSLLNTVLLYDKILGEPGLRSLDFLGRDLDRISNAVDMGRWYTQHMGMRVSVLDSGRYRLVTRIGDSGPIAYHRTAVLVPTVVSKDDHIHVRLSFVADDWRIDEISVADQWRRPVVRTLSAASVSLPDSKQNAGAIEALRDPDESYVITTPGQLFTVDFDVGQNVGRSRTWFVASQGYYTEWVRGAWIKSGTGRPFTPSSDALVDAIRAWRAKQGQMEKQFYSSRIVAR